MKSFLIALISLVFFNGCSVKMHTVSPAIEGIVVDADTNSSLPNVEIFNNIKTDKNGKFYIKGKKEWGIGTLMGGIWPIPVVMIQFYKSGYDTTSYGCEVLSNEDGCFNVVIKMHKTK